MTTIRIEEHFGLVNKIANKFRNSGIDLDDLRQAGMIGLMKAAENYNGSTAFSTYAYHSIRGHIQNEIRDWNRARDDSFGEDNDGNAIDPSDYRHDDFNGRMIARDTLNVVMSRLNKRERQVLSMRYGLDNKGSYTLEEIGKKLGLTKERVRQIESAALSTAHDLVN